ncbi:MAG: hypothetical protein OXG24_05420 [Gammaproteobacteria bacterium]|nr:hypothetical protein [Gammaproteobacteria bacterium]
MRQEASHSTKLGYFVIWVVAGLILIIKVGAVSAEESTSDSLADDPHALIEEEWNPLDVGGSY